MLGAGYRAGRRVDPSLVVLLGGLSKSDAGYLDDLCRAGAGAWFDAASIHPYTGSVDPGVCWRDETGRYAADAFCGIWAVRDVMVEHGDGDKPLWLTEIGWSTTTGDYGVTEQEQAAHLRTAFRQLEQMPFVTHAFWYASRNTWWLHDEPSSWQANVGLLGSDFRPKPALRALQAIARG